MATPEITGLRLDAELGVGGFARVYKAWDAEFDRYVAVKVLDAPFQDADSRRHFVRECRSLGRLSDHPGIITVHRTAETDTGRAALVMAYAEEGTWQDAIDRGALLTESGMLDAGRGLTDALAAAHSRNVLHLDIKPANVLVTYGHPMLADFGISRLMDRTMTVTVGQHKMTVQYAAPEMFAGETPSPATDVWSMAATLAAMVAGTPPFGSGENGLLAVMAAVTAGEPMDLRQHGLSRPVWDVLRQCFEKDPANRPADGSALAQALAAARESRGATAHVPPEVINTDPARTEHIPFTPPVTPEAGGPAGAEAEPSEGPAGHEVEDLPPAGWRAGWSPGASTQQPPLADDADLAGFFDEFFGTSSGRAAESAPAQPSQVIGVVRTGAGTEVAWRRDEGHRVTTLGVHWDRAELHELLREITREAGGLPPLEAVVGISRTDEIEAVRGILDAMGVRALRAVPRTTLLADHVMDQEISPAGDVMVVVAAEDIEVALVNIEQGVAEVRQRAWLASEEGLARDLTGGLQRPQHETSVVIAGPRAGQVSAPRRGDWRHVKVLTKPVLARAACRHHRILTGERKNALVLDSLVGDIAIDTPAGPHVLVADGRTIPLRVGDVMTTHEDGQTEIGADLLGGVPPAPRARIQLTDLPPQPAGVPQVRMDVEVQSGSVVEVTLTHEPTGRVATVGWDPLTPPLA